MGDAEVEHLGLAGQIDQDVAGFKVAMNDPLVMGVLQRVAHERNKLQPRRRVQTASANVFVQGHAIDEFHGEERPALFVQPRLMDLGDSHMLEPAQNLSFMVKPLDKLGETSPGRITLRATVRRGLSCSAR